MKQFIEGVDRPPLHTAAARRFEEEQEPERRRHLIDEVVLPGMVAGAVGATLMAVLAMAVSAVAGEGPWRPAVLVAGVFYRAGAPESAWAVLLGTAIHFAVAIGLATLFAMILPRGGTQTAALLLGLGFGLLVHVLLPTLLVPYLSPPLARGASGSALFLLHLAFGASLALVPTIRYVRRPSLRPVVVVPAGS